MKGIQGKVGRSLCAYFAEEQRWGNGATRIGHFQLRSGAYFLIAGLLILSLSSSGCKAAQLSKPAVRPSLIFTPTRTLPPTRTFTPTLTPSPTLGIGSSIVSEIDGMTLAYIPAGDFLMGLKAVDAGNYYEEMPQHTVYLDAYWIDKTEVTQAMYAKCVQAGKCDESSSYGSDDDNAPVDGVDWEHADNYCYWAGRRLPTEAEWEKAARGTDGRFYPWGNVKPDCTVCYNYLLPGRGASPYGVLNMVGVMVSEWVADWYDGDYFHNDGYYLHSPRNNPTGPDSGTFKVMRGGVYCSIDDQCRVALRFVTEPTRRSSDQGFRCAISAGKPVPTRTPTLTFTPHPDKTLVPYSDLFPMDWPMPGITDEQLDQVRNCAIETLSAERYPEKFKIDDLYYLYAPQSACDWAVLAYAYTEHKSDDEKLNENAKSAFAKAILENPGFAFSYPLFYRYFNAISIIKRPPISDQEITRVKIDYSWMGMGDPVKYKVDIQQANTTPKVTLTGYEPDTVMENLNHHPDKRLAQVLGSSLTDLLPIKSQFPLEICNDNNPDWVVSLTLQDGSEIVLKTNRSNMLDVGGPWQTTIKGQNYVQYSSGFVKALDDLIDGLGLPFGEPMAVTCSAVDVIELAFP
jgi:hypothetical protein